MKLTMNGIQAREQWAEAGISLPSYDMAAVRERTLAEPRWVHFGIGNIFRIFIGGIADKLLEEGRMDTGIICAEAYDFEIVDKIYKPHDCLCLGMTLHKDGAVDQRVIGSLAEALKASPACADWARLQAVFRAPTLQMVSFTITEKGYALRDAEGRLTPRTLREMEEGPELGAGARSDAKPVGTIALVTSLLCERFTAGGFPLALVSMDNCSENGRQLREAVLTMAKAWQERGLVAEEFLDWVSDESKVAFPWTMIDKITPRPGERALEMLKAEGVEDMDILVTEKKTFIAPFVNAEGPQYLVVEDSFPNGRPPLELAGVYMTDRETVNMSERMKVTVCLNPLHTALCTFGCLLGYEMFADLMADPELSKLAELVGPVEGMDVVPDPGILSPAAFLDEVLTERFPNVYLGDTTQRIATDISQMTGIRFGETIKSYVAKYGSAEKLVGIPLAIAGWIRYLLGVDDELRAMELAPDPMIPELQAHLAGVVVGKPESLKDQLHWILSNEYLFRSNLYEAGIGEKIEAMVREMLGGAGAVRKTLRHYLNPRA
ncbi:MAG: mannitol dehydrogenase family protein [Firmicutes bacterium]|nr:mannitol dehydrogenase family protein [Bacillota bacterium]